MRGFGRFFALGCMVVAMTAVASAGDRAALIQPDIVVRQIDGLPAITQVQGPLMVRYEVFVRNNSSEPITLQRIELGSVSPVSSYTLPRDARPYAVTIAPGEIARVEYNSLARTRGSLVGATAPVDLQGRAYFKSDAGAFTKVFFERITAGSPRDAG